MLEMLSETIYLSGYLTGCNLTLYRSFDIRSGNNKNCSLDNDKNRINYHSITYTKLENSFSSLYFTSIDFFESFISTLMEPVVTVFPQSSLFFNHRLLAVHIVLKM